MAPEGSSAAPVESQESTPEPAPLLTQAPESTSVQKLKSATDSTQEPSEPVPAPILDPVQLQEVVPYHGPISKSPELSTSTTTLKPSLVKPVSISTYATTRISTYATTRIPMAPSSLQRGFYSTQTMPAAFRSTLSGYTPGLTPTPPCAARLLWSCCLHPLDLFVWLG